MNDLDILDVLLTTLALGALVLWVYALVDLFRSTLKGNRRDNWLLVTVFVPFGFLLYLAIGRGNNAAAVVGRFEEVNNSNDGYSHSL
jgi:hypothetical protein